jgi:hypothetical protein
VLTNAQKIEIIAKIDGAANHNGLHKKCAIRVNLPLNKWQKHEILLHPLSSEHFTDVRGSIFLQSFDSHLPDHIMTLHHCESLK